MSEIAVSKELINIYERPFLDCIREMIKEMTVTQEIGPMYGPEKPKVIMNPKRFNAPGLGLYCLGEW